MTRSTAWAVKKANCFFVPHNKQNMAIIPPPHVQQSPKDKYDTFLLYVFNMSVFYLIFQDEQHCQEHNASSLSSCVKFRSRFSALRRYRIVSTTHCCQNISILSALPCPGFLTSNFIAGLDKALLLSLH